MRLKEIEARLAEIKEELNTRAAELTDEEITKLETEVTDLQEERTALLAAAEKRKKLLERIAAGEPTGGAGADTTLLRNFKGAGGAGAGEPEDKYDTMAYRKAFMNYVCRGVAIPAEYRAAETTTTADSGAVIPTTIMNEIIQKLESYGSIYAKVRKINVQGGVSIPIADLKPTAHWITEAKSSDDQKASAKNSVTFNYYGLECKISQSILANVVTLKMITDLFVPMATEAMVKAIEIAIFNGTGEGQPLGLPLGCGGPYLGYMAATDKLMRKLPGRIVGETTDDQGRRAYVLSLQAREQHIRREKASSNICSNEALCALTASVYMAAMGPEGMAEAARQCLSKAHYLAKALCAIPGVSLRYPGEYFHEFVTELPRVPEVLEALEQHGILGGLPVEGGILWCATEKVSRAVLDETAAVVKEVLSK